MSQITGFLVPPWYVSELPDTSYLSICSIIWGFTLCSAAYTAAKAGRQSWLAHCRQRLWSMYIMLVWGEWLACVLFSAVVWMFLRGIIPPGFWFFFCVALFWTVQVQCILHILINRVTVIMGNKDRARRLRNAVFFLMLLINISVFCIWIPARLQISQRFIRINDVWDRIEKCLFAIVDAGLNLLFLYLVRTQLINGGLTKYYPLFRLNVAMVCVSLSLDVILIGSMSVSNHVLYLQVHPPVYLIKLHIELNMAELICKVVRLSNPLNMSETEQVSTFTTGSVRRSRPRSSTAPPKTILQTLSHSDVRDPMSSPINAHPRVAAPSSAAQDGPPTVPMRTRSSTLDGAGSSRTRSSTLEAIDEEEGPAIRALQRRYSVM